MVSQPVHARGDVAAFPHGFRPYPQSDGRLEAAALFLHETVRLGAMPDGIRRG